MNAADGLLALERQLRLGEPGQRGRLLQEEAYTRPSTPLIHSYSSALVNLVARNSATAAAWSS